MLGSRRLDACTPCFGRPWRAGRLGHLSAATVVLVTGVTACGSDAPTTSPATPPPEASQECSEEAPLTTTTASFADDVAPLWEAHCGGMLCHVVPSDTTPQAFAERWVGVTGFATEDMLLIAPFDPDGSFLMHKLDGNQPCLDVACKLDGCGAPMPPGGQLLEPNERAVFRRWIADGATVE